MNNQEFHNEKTNTQPTGHRSGIALRIPRFEKFHEAAERALDHYLNPAAQIMASTHEPEPMFLANPKYDTESLLVNASESLGVATEGESITIGWNRSLPMAMLFIYQTYRCAPPRRAHTG
jgi:hypothetical protein